MHLQPTYIIKKYKEKCLDFNKYNEKVNINKKKGKNFYN